MGRVSGAAACWGLDNVGPMAVGLEPTDICLKALRPACGASNVEGGHDTCGI